MKTAEAVSSLDLEELSELDPASLVAKMLRCKINSMGSLLSK